MINITTSPGCGQSAASAGSCCPEAAVGLHPVRLSVDGQRSDVKYDNLNHDAGATVTLNSGRDQWVPKVDAAAAAYLLILWRNLLPLHTNLQRVPVNSHLQGMPKMSDNDVQCTRQGHRARIAPQMPCQVAAVTTRWSSCLLVTLICSLLTPASPMPCQTSVLSDIWTLGQPSSR